MSKKNRLIVLLYVAALCSQNLCAQPRVMGVEEMFRLADENSRSVQVYATGKEAASEALKAARNQRLLISQLPFQAVTGETASFGTEISVMR